MKQKSTWLKGKSWQLFFGLGELLGAVPHKGELKPWDDLLDIHDA